MTTPASRAHELALQLPFDRVDLVPQSLSDQVLWHSVFGWAASPPPPGPGMSSREQDRSTVAVDAFGQQRSIVDALRSISPSDREDE